MIEKEHPYCAGSGRGCAMWKETGWRGGTGTLRRMDSGAAVKRRVDVIEYNGLTPPQVVGSCETVKASQVETHLSIVRAGFDGGRGAILIPIEGEGDVPCFVDGGDLLGDTDGFARGNQWPLDHPKVLEHDEILRQLEGLARGAVTPGVP